MQKIIIAGFGFMGTMHAQIYQALEQATIVGIVDTATEKARDSMKELGIDAPLFSDLDAALSGTEADVVDICLPTDHHLENSLKATRAGKNIFVEKPLALSHADAQAIAKAVDAAGVKAQVGQCIRFWPEYMAFKRFVESGEAGQLRSLTLQRRAALPTHSQDQWILDAKRSGGAAVDLHVHDTDFILYLLGTPQAVRSLTPGKEAGPPQIFTQYVYNDVSVTAECGWNYPTNWGFQMALQAVFGEGAVEFDSGADPTLVATVREEEKKPLPFDNPSIGTSATGAGNISALGGYFNELQSFIHALEAGEAPKTATPADAAESLRVVMAELESAQSGKEVRL